MICDKISNRKEGGGFMVTPLYEMFNITSNVSIIIVSISLMLISGFLMTRITKRLRLPNVTAYILAGILIGP